MPMLADARHEQFAQLVASGEHDLKKVFYACHFDTTSKYDPKTGPWIIFRLKMVSRRIAELQAGHARRNNITIDTILQRLEEARLMAIDMERPADAITAAMGQAKLCGFLVDRVEDVTPRKPVAVPTDEKRMSIEQWQKMVGPDATLWMESHDGQATPQGAKGNGHGNGHA